MMGTIMSPLHSWGTIMPLLHWWLDYYVFSSLMGD
jgi:hypothetical protein